VLVDELQANAPGLEPGILNGKKTKAEIFLTQPEIAASNGAMDRPSSMARDLVGKATVGK